MKVQSSNDVVVHGQPRGNTTKAKAAEDNGVGTFITGAALGVLIIGLAGKSK
ncbi:hypothetical protein ACRN9A_03435 [Shewanella frigidimarina]|uniref:hypothetical protein n=1 Tax=Shewanella frigidimarina TaxID=56812 RepID=UPI003D7A48F1